MPQKKVSFNHYLEYAFLSALVFLSKYSPAWALRLDKRILLFFLRHGTRKHSRLITHNLTIAFPAAPASSREELKKNIYDHFANIFLEIVRTFARKNPQAILARSKINHAEIITQALQKKRGVLIFSAHFGNWEWIPLLLHSKLNKDINSIVRPMDNPLIENRVREFREAMGSKIIYKLGSLRTILKRLAENEIILLLIDQNTVPREGIFVEFFSKQATVNTTVAQLSLKKGIPVVPVFLHYEQDEIVLDILPEIDYCQRDSGADDLRELTQQLTGLIESQIRRFPEQWFWFHNRWKTKPQGETHESP
jgi:KDO2-lipid IV(A) lauroyltransferase